MLVAGVRLSPPGFIRQPKFFTHRQDRPGRPRNNPAQGPAATPALITRPEQKIPERLPIFTAEFVAENPEWAANVLNASYYDLVDLEKAARK